MHALARAQVSGKAFKMAAYGAFISAPVSHTLVNALQRVFAGKTGLQARLGMLLASQLIVAPIQIVGESLSARHARGGRQEVDEPECSCGRLCVRSVPGGHGCHQRRQDP